MREDHSFGVVPIRQEKGEWRVLCVQHRGGHWGFPKGHANSGETAKETAERELFEETGLKVDRYLVEPSFRESYSFIAGQERIFKTVDYYLSVVYGDLAIDNHEIVEAAWFTFSDALERLSFAEAKKICQSCKAVCVENL